MDTALPQKFPFILDSNLAKANCTGNQVCTSCDIVVLEYTLVSHSVLPVAADIADHHEPIVCIDTAGAPHRVLLCSDARGQRNKHAANTGLRAVGVRCKTFQ